MFENKQKKWWNKMCTRLDLPMSNRTFVSSLEFNLVKFAFSFTAASVICEHRRQFEHLFISFWYFSLISIFSSFSIFCFEFTVCALFNSSVFRPVSAKCCYSGAGRFFSEAPSFESMINFREYCCGITFFDFFISVKFDSLFFLFRRDERKNPFITNNTDQHSLWL